MRIALVGPFPLYPFTTFGGGVETSASHLIEGLRTFDDIELHVVTDNSSIQKPRYVEHNDVHYHYLPSPGRLQILTIMIDRFRIHRTLHKINPDVVHAQNSQRHAFICLQTTYPTVVTSHGIVREEAKYDTRLSHRLRSILRSELMQKYCIKKAKYLIQTTRYTEQYFADLIQGKIYDISNPIADKFFEAENQPQHARLLYSGLVVRLKRLLDLIKALAIVKRKFPNVSLRVAGDTPDQEYLQSIKTYISEHGLTDNVTFLGLLTQAGLVEEYSQSTMLVHPSGQENSPLVIAEAMAVGKPVIATRVGGVPYLIEEGDTGFIVEVGDIDALSHRILTVLSDETLQARMSKLAKKKANLQFRSQQVAARVRQVYCEAIEDAKCRA